jgi:beta-lactamase regulating signal transducer with metallopeptidase domain/tetratricopeptide (TPR) repeat protein
MEILARAGLAGFVLALKATAILAVGFLVFRALPRRSASARHLAALLALLGAALVPALSPVLPRWDWRVLPEAVAPSARTSRVWAAEEPKIFSEGEKTRASARTAVPMSALVERVGPAGVALPEEPSPVRRRPVTAGDVFAAVALVWAFGAAAMLTQLLGGLLAVRGLVRRARPLADDAWTAAADEARRILGIPRPVALLASRDTEVPLTARVFRPVLVLPEAASSWDADRRRVVLLHELAHVSRRDTLARIAAETVAAFYWFHPLAHAAVAALRRESERAADDLVLASGTRPSDYAAHLVAIVRGLAREPERWAFAMARPSQVEERVRAILDPAVEHRPMGAWQVRLAAAALVAGAAALGAVGVAAAPRSEETAAPTVFVQKARTSTSTSTATSTRVETASRKSPLAAPKGESGSSAYSRGMQNHERGRYDEAIAAFRKAIDLGYREDASAYNIACGYALKGDSDHAFEWLRKSASYGFNVESYLTDDDLDSLRSDPRWKDLKRDARAARMDAKKAKGDRAAARVDRLVAAGGKDGAALYRSGTELLNAGRYDAAEKAFRASAAAGNRVAASTYNAACALARAGKKAEALDTLQKAIEQGYTDARHMERDDDLDSIQGEKRFADLVNLAEDLSLDAGVEGFMGNFLPHTARTAWRGEIPHYEKVAKAHPTLGIAWYNLGYAQLMGDRPEAAAESLGKALGLGYRKPTTLYNLACAEARAGNADKAFDHLFAAIDAGFDSADHIRNDSDLDAIRRDPRFKQAVAKARAQRDAKEDRED